MKNKITFRLISRALTIILILLHAVQPLRAQDSLQMFDIVKPFKKTTYDGKTFKQLRQEGVHVMKDILKPLNDPAVNRHIRISKGCVVAQYLLLSTSMGLVISGGVKAAGGNSIESYNNSSELMLAGVCLLIPSISFGITSNRHFAKAVKSYNAAVSNVGVTLLTLPGRNSTVPGIRLKLSF